MKDGAGWDDHDIEADEDLNRLSYAVIGAAIEVHRVLGPGFLESVYEEALCLELRLRSIPFVRQASVGIAYKGHSVGDARLDLLVEDRLIVELKAVENLLPIHFSQVLSYLRATHRPLGLLINFNVRNLSRGVHRIIHSSSPSPHPLRTLRFNQATRGGS